MVRILCNGLRKNFNRYLDILISMLVISNKWFFEF